MAKTFSEHAEDQMWTLFKDSANQVGSKYSGPLDKTGKTATDCVTYVRRVLEYAYSQVGNQTAVAGVRANFEKGTKLAQYLVSIGWSAYYWNPNVKDPPDGSSEHPFSYQKAQREHAYYAVPIKGYIINYKAPVPPAPQNEGIASSIWRRVMAAPSSAAIMTPMTVFGDFCKVRFAFGLARGGMHTFLVSKGQVFEVHWNDIGGQAGSNLYERSPFISYGWYSGLVVTPADSGFTL
jgi:hypothetical protein